jgi:hypothetical protein
MHQIKYHACIKRNLEKNCIKELTGLYDREHKEPTYSSITRISSFYSNELAALRNFFVQAREFLLVYPR